MIKKIKTPSVMLGMYVHAFGEGSHAVNFQKPPFLVEKHSTRLRLQTSNIQCIWIDTEKGVDGGIEIAERPYGAAPVLLNERLRAERPKKISVQEELPVAREIVAQANAIMKNMMTDIRMGKSLEVQALEPLSEKIMGSVMRNSSALVSLARIKNKDDYTFMHSVSVAGLMVVLAKNNLMDDEIIYEVALGGLLHDIGKMITPNEILNKPGALTPEEFVIMRDHVMEAERLLEKSLHLSRNTLDVIFQHHEKVDGSGYPLGLKGDQISEVGKMSAIVDVYDALTSIRVYKPAWEPAFTLKKMMEWTDQHLDKAQLFKFVNCLGVYPVGSFVEMLSGKVGIVVDQHESYITKPLIKFFYHIEKKYTDVELIDLSQEKVDRILMPISPDKYGFDANQHLNKVV